MRSSLSAVVWLGCAVLPAQDPARLDAHRITSREFAVERFGPVRWLDGSHYATLEPKLVASGEQVLELVRYEAVTGAREVLVHAELLAVPGERRSIAIEDYAFSPDRRHLLVFTDTERVWRVNSRGEYYVLPLDGSKPPRRLGRDLPKSKLMFCKFSPDGTRVAYVCERDVYVEDVASGAQARLTDSGSDTIINGTFDWAYEEEFRCRDGFRWSPDGTHIAYWQLDCSGVGTFLMIDNLSDRYAKVVPVEYPKAGTTNSSCRVGVIPAVGGETVWMQTPGDPRETYVPRMEWHPDGRELMLQWLPRDQRHLVVYGADAKTGALRKVHEEREDAWIDVRQDFRWVDGGARFFWTSDVAFHEGDGPKYRQCGTIAWAPEDAAAARPVVLTRGFDVIAVEHAAIDDQQLYVSASPQDATQKYLFSAAGGAGGELVFPDGGAGMPKRYSEYVPGGLGKRPGWHEYQISPDGSLAIHTASAIDMPPVIELVRLPSHEHVRTLVDNRKLRETYKQLELGTHRFFEVEIEDGVTLDGWVLLPKDFDDSKKWPVVCHVYNEPPAQTVRDVWPLRHHLFHLWLAQQGYVVMSVDGRGTPAPKGRAWRKSIYQKIGVISSHDWNLAMHKLLDGAAWMDRERLAIWGWSGGGAMTLNMLFRYPDLFCCGMSIAPVTDITLYDTIYQERYCGDPRLVPEVYERCSPITHCKNLEAALLLIHGTGDDNVHWQNSERLFDALVAHDKMFEYLAYPNRTHSVKERENTPAHLYGALRDFLGRRLPAGPRERESK